MRKDSITKYQIMAKLHTKQPIQLDILNCSNLLQIAHNEIASNNLRWKYLSSFLDMEIFC